MTKLMVNGLLHFSLLTIGHASLTAIIKSSKQIVFNSILTDIDECESNPCKNSARCVDSVASYNCLCTAGYDGDNCEYGKSFILDTRFKIKQYSFYIRIE